MIHDPRWYSSGIQKNMRPSPGGSGLGEVAIHAQGRWFLIWTFFWSEVGHEVWLNHTTDEVESFGVNDSNKTETEAHHHIHHHALSETRHLKGFVFGIFGSTEN